MRKAKTRLCPNFLSSFAALRYKNYRIFFIAQSISLIGFWMQRVAQGYLVFQMTQSPFWVGAVDAISSLPTMLLALVGGTLVDRFPKKNIFRITQSLQLILVTFTGVLIVTNNINLWSLALMVFLLGIVLTMIKYVVF